MTSLFSTQSSSSTSSRTPTRWGLSDPMSLDGPSDQDLVSSGNLDQYLHQLGMIEDLAESEKRERVLGELNEICQKWAKEQVLKSELPQMIIEETRVKLCTFGSYRLGVHVAGSDIDALLIGPSHITREMFFEELVKVLGEDTRVGKLSAVVDAYVPVLKFEFDEIEIDLLYASVAMDIIPEDLDLFDNNILKNLDQKTTRSLNGVRVTDMILSLVPNVTNFRATLRAIKYWAKQRGIYGNVFGFCGGVTWAMLTARVCQLYPNAAPNTLIQKFFMFYMLWKWPTPIMLTNIIQVDKLNHIQWNQQYSKDLFPVITPAYPCMNSTYNVSPATKRIMESEFKRGQDICAGVGSRVWEIESYQELFKPTDIFLDHKDFIQVLAWAATEDDFHKWSGWVESKMRFLISGIDNAPGVSAYPFPNAFKHNVNSENPYCVAFYIGLEFGEFLLKDKKPKIDLKPPISEFLALIEGEFENKLETMKVLISHVRNYELPHYVFFDERRPQKKKKRKNSTADQADSKKAKASENDISSSEPVDGESMHPEAVPAE
jgi:poly(A) polymerase